MATVRTRASKWPRTPAEEPYDVKGFGWALLLAMVVGAVTWAAVIASVVKYL
jgi:hypothetical protein